MFRLLIAMFFMLPLFPAASAAADDAVIAIAAVGDVMMGSDYPDAKLPPKDGQGIFDAVKPALLGQDVVFGNLEGPLLDGGGKSSKCDQRASCYSFRTPTRYVRHLVDAGFTALGVANNHASDFGEEGRESTVLALRGAGIHPVGGSATARFERKGKRIAVAGFSYSTSTPYSHSIFDIAEAGRIVRELKAQNDLVIVSFHGGAEGRQAQQVSDKPEKFLGEDRGSVVRFSRAVIDAGADLVIGHGPHVLRALEVYRGKLIAYSLGNFLAYERFNIDGPSGRSVVLQARLDADTGAFLGGRLVPVRLVNEGIPEPDPERQGVEIIRRLTRRDIPRPVIGIGDDGTLTLQ